MLPCGSFRYTGPLCSQCEPGYGKLDGTACSECLSPVLSYAMMAGGFVLIMGAITYLIRQTIKDEGNISAK